MAFLFLVQWQLAEADAPVGLPARGLVTYSNSRCCWKGPGKGSARTRVGEGGKKTKGRGIVQLHLKQLNKKRSRQTALRTM